MRWIRTSQQKGVRLKWELFMNTLPDGKTMVQSFLLLKHEHSAEWSPKDPSYIVWLYEGTGTFRSHSTEYLEVKRCLQQWIVLLTWLSDRVFLLQRFLLAVRSLWAPNSLSALRLDLARCRGSTAVCTMQRGEAEKLCFHQTVSYTTPASSAVSGSL